MKKPDLETTSWMILSDILEKVTTISQRTDHQLPGARENGWRRQWHPTPVLLPGKSQGRGSLVGCRLWGHTESDTTEAT